MTNQEIPHDIFEAERELLKKRNELATHYWATDADIMVDYLIAYLDLDNEIGGSLLGLPPVQKSANKIEYHSKEASHQELISQDFVAWENQAQYFSRLSEEGQSAYRNVVVACLKYITSKREKAKHLGHDRPPLKKTKKEINVFTLICNEGAVLKDALIAIDEIKKVDDVSV